MYDVRTPLPIVKMGVLSTDPARSYRIPREFFGTDTLNNFLRRDTSFVFLLDVNALHGSSGSLVTLRGRPQGLLSESRLSIWDKPPVVIGIFAGVVSEKTQAG